MKNKKIIYAIIGIAILISIVVIIAIISNKPMPIDHTPKESTSILEELKKKYPDKKYLKLTGGEILNENTYFNEYTFISNNKAYIFDPAKLKNDELSYVKVYDIPEDLKVIGRDEKGQIMAVCHKEYPVYGIQFHPESILTEMGMRILENFLTNIAGIRLEDSTKEETMSAVNQETLKPFLAKIVEGNHLTEEEAYKAMDCIMSGNATDAQMGSFLTGLRMNHETPEEITGFAKVMRAKAAIVPEETEAIDIVGTGGDLANSFNISTTSAFVVAAGGVPVAKHGNRAASSKCGAADVLEALGVNITVSPAQSAQMLKDINICFLFAQKYHTAMRYVANVRKELGIRTVFNILGPLSNPAGANMQVMGVYDEKLVEPLARVLSNLGVKNAMVVYGQDCLDEISMSAPTSVCEIKDGWFQSYEITPEQFGYTRCSKEDLVGGTPQENAEITRAILKGEEKGPKRQAVCLNAGAALYIAGKAETLEAGVRMAEQLIDNGAAMKKLEEFVVKSNA